MFSALGRIFLDRHRYAENADARLDILRHDPDQQRSKNKPDDRDRFDATEDRATVSIDALEVFLLNFLKSLDSGDQKGVSLSQKSSPAQQDLFKTHEDAAPNPIAAQAALAYTKTAAHVEKQSFPSRSFEKTSEDLPVSLNEIRTIHHLLEDLKKLRKKNVKSLTIERNQTFLNSLASSVEKTKEALG